MSWQKSLVFPAEVPISEQARDTIVRLCCEAEHRAGSQHGLQDIKNMTFFQVAERMLTDVYGCSGC